LLEKKFNTTKLVVQKMGAISILSWDGSGVPDTLTWQVAPRFSSWTITVER
jgi:hypothetical protein